MNSSSNYTSDSLTVRSRPFAAGSQLLRLFVPARQLRYLCSAQFTSTPHLTPVNFSTDFDRLRKLSGYLAIGKFSKNVLHRCRLESDYGPL